MEATPGIRTGGAGGLLAEQWPTLAAAMQRYQREVAETFAAEAYGCVHNGLIRLDDRSRLAARAEGLGIRAFDAQLLIACAIRRWALDHQDDWKRSTDAARNVRRRRWRWALRLAVVALAAAGLDAILVWGWLV